MEAYDPWNIPRFLALNYSSIYIYIHIHIYYISIS